MLHVVVTVADRVVIGDILQFHNAPIMVSCFDCKVKGVLTNKPCGHSFYLESNKKAPLLRGWKVMLLQKSIAESEPSFFDREQGN